MTPATLKLIRRHFGLSRQQAALWLEQDSRRWYRWEQGLEPIPDRFADRLRRAVARLVKSRAWRLKHCPACRKLVNRTDQPPQRKARCQYCSTLLTRTNKQLTREALPAYNPKRRERR